MWALGCEHANAACHPRPRKPSSDFRMRRCVGSRVRCDPSKRAVAGWIARPYTHICTVLRPHKWCPRTSGYNGEASMRHVDESVRRGALTPGPCAPGRCTLPPSPENSPYWLPARPRPPRELVIDWHTLPASCRTMSARDRATPVYCT
jgi:hypothetical protein